MKSTHDIILEFSRQVKRILGTKLTKVILYGSYARGDYKDNSDIDIMVLTTLTDEEIDKIIGLELGADDYITKPFSVRELMARVKANLRKVEEEKNAKLKDDFSAIFSLH